VLKVSRFDRIPIRKIHCVLLKTAETLPFRFEALRRRVSDGIKNTLTCSAKLVSIIPNVIIDKPAPTTAYSHNHIVNVVKKMWGPFPLVLHWE